MPSMNGTIRGVIHSYGDWISRRLGVCNRAVGGEPDETAPAALRRRETTARRPASRKEAVRLLVVDRGVDVGSPEGHQAIPFDMYAHELRRKLSVVVRRVTAMELEEVEAAVRDHPADVALIFLSWRTPPDQAANLIDRLRRQPNPPKLALMDYFAPAGSPFLPLASLIDCYVKRQHLVDPLDYQNDYEGGLIFTDYLARRMGYDLEGWNFGGKLPIEHVDKLVTGWNLGITPRYRRRLKVARRLGALWPLRPIDIHRRFSPPSATNEKQEWYETYRQQAAAALDGLAPRRRLTGAGRIHHRLYLAELCASKVVFSPFGWGEVCFRDYEAIVTGGLLVKPSMDHLKTHPDVYRPHETYVPVRWDLADLPEACEHYLSRPAEAMRIICNAQEVLHTYYEDGGFAKNVQNFIDRAMQAPVQEHAGFESYAPRSAGEGSPLTQHPRRKLRRRPDPAPSSRTMGEPRGPQAAADRSEPAPRDRQG